MLLNRLRSASFLKKPQRLRRKPNKIPEYLRQSIENCSHHMANQLLDKNGRISRRKTWVCLLRDQRIVTSAPWTVSAISCWYWFVSNHKRNVLSSPLNSGFGSGPEGKTSRIMNKQFVVSVCRVISYKHISALADFYPCYLCAKMPHAAVTTWPPKTDQGK